MNAREDLFAGVSRRLPIDVRNALIDAYAQEVLRGTAAASLLLGQDTLKEAAELIRERLRRTDHSYDASRWNQVVDKCADMIDPSAASAAPDVTG